jgi:hypothetical protein
MGISWDWKWMWLDVNGMCYDINMMYIYIFIMIYHICVVIILWYLLNFRGGIRAGTCCTILLCWDGFRGDVFFGPTASSTALPSWLLFCQAEAHEITRVCIDNYLY